VKPSKVREGMAETGDNRQGAEASAALSAYNARRQTSALRSILLLVPSAVVVTVLWSPVLGFDLVLGGACGLGNMLLVMRNNERLLDGRRSTGVYGLVNVIRILGVGFVPVFAAVTGPWWSMGISLAGFFTPLVMYAAALRREYSTE